MWIASGMTLAGALASGGATQHMVRPPETPTLLSDRIPRSGFSTRASRQEGVTPAVDHALRAAHAQSTKLIALL